MKIAAWIVGSIAVAAAVVYGSFALYMGSWSLAQHNANHRAELIINGFNYQSTLGQQITSNISAVAHDTSDISNAQAQNLNDLAANLKSQRQADAQTVCQEATQVNGSLPTGFSQSVWISENCNNDGSLNPTSVFFVRAGN